jgi:hypothetical protein
MASISQKTSASTDAAFVSDEPIPLNLIMTFSHFSVRKGHDEIEWDGFRFFEY